ncbi:MAG: alkaline phosphatase PafA [Thermonemataceae bacterium]|nr:alkaline phosphatase PafA [Thermonemataceae bacterium]
MKKIAKFMFIIFLGGFTKQVTAQNSPKVVVGIVIDQMRYDFLYRYYDNYSERGFKRILKDGFNCKNNHYHYALTYTGPGHAAIYTGALPAINGIVGNEWYEQNGKLMYVVEDSTVQGVGTKEKAGQMSPRNLWSTTITDQLRLATQFRAKVIGVALKDRASILPAGHTANAAYWFESGSGKWITSSYYMQNLPSWVEQFNNSSKVKDFTQKNWELLRNRDMYKNAEEDKQPYELKLKGEENPTFPHKIDKTSLLPYSPWGNTLTKEFALEAFKQEQLGKRGVTDFLAISFSSTDIVGHSFGPFSLENQDMYMRLDLEIADILDFLDREVGKNNYLLFLTADHGVVDIPAFDRKNKIPAGNASAELHLKMLQDACNKKWGNAEYIKYTENQQLYLNHQTLKAKNIEVEDVYELCKETLLNQDEVYELVNLWDNEIDEVLPRHYADLVKNAYNPKRSGEIMILLKPNWLYGFSKGGTSHGTFYSYDTHVPLLWYGWRIPKGETNRKTHIADIAPTLAALLSILEPNASVGEPILEIFRK